MADTTETPDTTKAKVFETVSLVDPIQRGDQVIEKITLRKPRAGEMRGLTLQELISSDVSAILKVIPRISEPVLTTHECDKLDPADLTEIGGTIRGFFMTTAERRMVEALIAEQQPKT